MLFIVVDGLLLFSLIDCCLLFSHFQSSKNSKGGGESVTLQTPVVDDKGWLLDVLSLLYNYFFFPSFHL